MTLAKDAQKYLVQCKHWRTRQVGVTVVRELHGVVAAEQATGGYLVTSGTFTREAWQFAQKCAIELIDGDKLESMIREVEVKRDSGTTAPRALTSFTHITPQCPKCGSPMVKRVAREGSNAGREFWGVKPFRAAAASWPLARRILAPKTCSPFLSISP